MSRLARWIVVKLGSIATGRPLTLLILAVLNDYADRIAPLNPVITPAEISDHSSLAPVTIMAVAGIASLSRTYPHHLFASVRARLHALIEETDVMRTSTFANIQTLLITTMSAELNGVTSVAASSLSWIRMGTVRHTGLRRATRVHFISSLRSWL